MIRPPRIHTAFARPVPALLILASALALLGCDDDPTETFGDAEPDFVAPDTYLDPCAGVPQCALEGTFCNGETLTTCGLDNNGCIVRVDEVECTQIGQVCDPVALACMGVGPCSGLDLCAADAPALVCEGDSLVRCAENADGCLLRTETACAADGGTCDASGTAPRCAGGASDPCADKTACAAKQRSCDGNFLEVCDYDLYGCLAEERYSCGSGATCTTNGAISICQSEGACDGVETCPQIGRSCDGGTLTVCAIDQRGCQTATELDCTDVDGGLFGYCDAMGDVASCVVSDTDPCSQFETCNTEGTACEGSQLLTCATDPVLGCIIATRVDCAEAGGTCSMDASGGVCTGACDAVDECPADTWCDGQNLVTCAPDNFGCLVETDRTPCGASQTCDAAAMACIDSLCAQRAGELACNASIVTGNTSTGQNDITGYCGANGDFPGPEAIWELTATGDQIVEIVADGFSVDTDLFAAAGTNLGCDATTFATCLDSSTSGSTNSETVSFDLADGETAYVAVDVYNDPGTTPYSLSVTCTERTMGGNGDTCATAIPLVDGIYTYSTSGLANDYDSYGGNCSESGDGADIVFAVQVAPGDTIDVILSPLDGQDTVLAISTGCPQIENTCSASDDALFADETAAWTNNTGASKTVYVTVDGYFAGDDGAFQIDMLTL